MHSMLVNKLMISQITKLKEFDDSRCAFGMKKERKTDNKQKLLPADSQLRSANRLSIRSPSSWGKRFG